MIYIHRLESSGFSSIEAPKEGEEAKEKGIIRYLFHRFEAIEQMG